MKTLLLGDTHGRDVWKRIIKEETPDKVIFVGDYFDSFDIKAVDQLNNFNEIVKYQRTSDIEVILLIGNHDHHYLVDQRYEGYQPTFRWDFEFAIRDNLRNMSIAHIHDNLLISHAGISEKWLDNNLLGWDIETLEDSINDLYRYRPNKFDFVGFSPTGNDPISGPLWIRPPSLMRANKNGILKKNFIQIFGHSYSQSICIKHFEKATGSKYLNIDSIENGWYVIYEHNKLTIKQLN